MARSSLLAPASVLLLTTYPHRQRRRYRSNKPLPTGRTACLPRNRQNFILVHRPFDAGTFLWVGSVGCPFGEVIGGRIADTVARGGFEPLAEFLAGGKVDPKADLNHLDDIFFHF